MTEFEFIQFFGGILGGFLSSLVFVVFWEWLHKPSLRLEWLSNDHTIVEGDMRVRFYHMRVHNEGRSTAENCYLTINYSDFVFEPLITLNPGKWDANPEPMRLNTGLTTPFFDISFLHQIGRVSIRAHSSETFCFLLKVENDENCYGFNADNYRPGNLLPEDRRFGEGDFMITFNIHGDNVTHCSTFLMRNTGTHLNDVNLQEKKIL